MRLMMQATHSIRVALETMRTVGLATIRSPARLGTRRRRPTAMRREMTAKIPIPARVLVGRMAMPTGRPPAQDGFKVTER
jgi:hypothetical protein